MTLGATTGYVMTKESNKYLLVGDAQILIAQLRKCKARALKIYDHNSEQHCELMIMGYVGRELTQEGLAGREFSDKMLEIMTTLKATIEADKASN